ncbi:hypothetical protein CEUSTIGMA_g2825.t1 [Chlamydomonas eustigma]|uniref:FIST domain-containing protein n=1 Tax=Chlamydomonas eustigma TaxID=1157962 RepID=A0A250WX38_9CHLO|nr:hypothetical protein CEUSTIGMA_g2825.t1 [Chlamydomonas eustigma]|eukprot:GAX75381.1 hypothetical protein CEUSTIGMA_g2825.t1 [Chlamydomonas eustigma]
MITEVIRRALQVSLIRTPSSLSACACIRIYRDFGTSNLNAAFATAGSIDSNPRNAVVECVLNVSKQLGDNKFPNFCLIFANAEHFGVHVSQISEWAREVFRSNTGQRPTVLGCVLQGVSSGSNRYLPSQPGVSLWAAHLPGVELIPFHTKGEDLPELPTGTWQRLVRRSMEKDTSTAALLFSPPHFFDNELLMQRIRSALPRSQIVGAISCPGAWGPLQESEGKQGWGAVYLDDKVMAKGVAVGCFLQGNFQLNTAIIPGFEPIGPSMTVTAAVRNLVLELDGQEAHDKIREVAMEAHRYNSIHRSNLKLGLDDSFPETSRGLTEVVLRNDEGMVLRNWAAVPGASGRTALLLPSIRDVLEGSRIQLHSRRGSIVMRNETADAVKGLAAGSTDAPPSPSGAADGASSSGALLFSCSGLPNWEPSGVLASLPPSCALAGGKVEGEMGARGDRAPRLHSYSKLIAWFRGKPCN